MINEIKSLAVIEEENTHRCAVSVCCLEPLVKFLRYMQLRKLKGSITAADDVEITAAKNEVTFAELIQCLDDKSLALVMRDA